MISGVYFTFFIGTFSQKAWSPTNPVRFNATSENIQDYIQLNYDEATQTAIISIDRDGTSSSQYDMAEYLTLANIEKSVTLDELLQNNQIVF
ncbi:type I secretion C-terminal target domain-containing protein [Acinetobacter sp. YIM 103518]|uniref:Type I secretion C-terminal target domain-containing protein n=2 Tax=Acinetobacter faecalis TaxID=2665161 RepID=A0A6L6GIJ8_9GAMM|nr:type I secretion C-terminal target domain-containing protein [Acinetobacter faecalis]